MDHFSLVAVITWALVGAPAACLAVSGPPVALTATNATGNPVTASDT